MPTPSERLEFAVRQLDSGDEAQRLRGATELLELAHEPGVALVVRPRLLALFTDDHPQLRAASCRGLAALGASPDLLGLLERAARDPEPPVRREAVRAMSGLEDRGAVPSLAAALRDDDAQVKFEAAVGLAILGDASGVEILLEAGEDKVRRFFALGALARLGELRAKDLAERILRKRFFISEFERAQAAGLLAKIGSQEGRLYLLDRLRKTRADDRGLAMELCGEHKITEAIIPLREALADRRELFRGTAARSLGMLGDAGSAAALIALAGDASDDFEVRCDAMEGLMFLRSPEAVAALHALSSNGESETTRSAANDALDWLQRNPERS